MNLTIVLYSSDYEELSFLLIYKFLESLHQIQLWLAMEKIVSGVYFMYGCSHSDMSFFILYLCFFVGFCIP